MIDSDNIVLDDLGIKNYMIYQLKDGFKFGIDAVLLANFVRVKKGEIGIDLCSGTGIIPILINAKSNIGKITGVEIQEKMVELANKSAQYNNIADKIKFINDDIKNLRKHFVKDSIDFITVNPPYFKIDTLVSQNDKKNISRHEILVKLEDIFEISSYLLKPKKSLYMIHKPERLVEMFLLSKKYRLEPKEICFVHPNEFKAPNLVITKYVKDGNEGLKYHRPLFVYDKDGNYTCEIEKLYSQENIEV